VETKYDIVGGSVADGWLAMLKERVGASTNVPIRDYPLDAETLAKCLSCISVQV